LEDGQERTGGSLLEAIPETMTASKSLAALLQPGGLAAARFGADDSGQDLVEYALVAACIGLATVTGVHGLAVKIAGFMDFVLLGFNGAVAGSF
jgi:Flp pilus assembly pilin Flp